MQKLFYNIFLQNQACYYGQSQKLLNFTAYGRQTARQTDRQYTAHKKLRIFDFE